MTQEFDRASLLDFKWEEAASYRGEGFVWYQYTDWSTLLNSEYLPWFTQHQAPVEKTSLILWVRTDIFPDAQNSSAAAAQP